MEDILAHEGIPVYHLGKRPGLDLRMVPRIDRVIRELRPTVVHTHLSVLRYSLPSQLLRCVPVSVHTVHSVAEKEVDRVGRMVHRLAFRTGVVPVSIATEVAQSLKRVYGLTESPCIPNGIPVERYRRPRVDRETWRDQEGFFSDDVLYVCVARFSPAKNHRLLVEAFARGPARDPQAHLLLAGTGDLEPDVKAQVQALGIERQVHLLGVRRDVPDLLAASDVFVLSSEWEGNPLSVMEAMAAGLPTICTAVGGVPELVDTGVNGILVPRRDADSLSSAMVQLISDPPKRRSLGEAARRTADSRFDLVHMVRAYERLYCNVQ